MVGSPELRVGTSGCVIAIVKQSHSSFDSAPPDSCTSSLTQPQSPGEGDEPVSPATRGQSVDWHPWGEEALELARREDKPILLSIGYSACHWCHVMAHESFEDPATRGGDERAVRQHQGGPRGAARPRQDLSDCASDAHAARRRLAADHVSVAARSASVLRRHLLPERAALRHAVVRRPAAAGARVLSHARGGHREAERGSAAGVRRAAA